MALAGENPEKSCIYAGISSSPPLLLSHAPLCYPRALAWLGKLRVLQIPWHRHGFGHQPGSWRGRGCAVGRVPRWAGRTARGEHRWARSRGHHMGTWGPPDCLTGDWEGVSGAMLQLSWCIPGEPGGDGVGHCSPLAPGDIAG